MPPPSSSILERTFLHLPGIGEVRERALWQAGITGWGELEDALRSGVRPADLLAEPGSPPPGRGTLVQLHPTSKRWLESLADSHRALEGRRYQYFLERLRPAEHWRVLASRPDDALWLDIETTGASPDLGDVTVVGVSYRGEFRQWVQPTSFEELCLLVEEAPLMVTYNGKAFDVPFLRSRVARFPLPAAHVDLMHVCRRAKRRGGQKGVERGLGLIRPPEVTGLSGLDAVRLWELGLRGDPAALARLLAYNREDVVMMPRIAARVLRELATELGLPEPAIGAVAVGIELAARPEEPSGWCRVEDGQIVSCRTFRDADLLALTRGARPRVVALRALPISDERARTVRGLLEREGYRVVEPPSGELPPTPAPSRATSEEGTALSAALWAVSRFRLG